MTTTPEEEYRKHIVNLKEINADLDMLKRRLYFTIEELQKFEMSHQHEWVITKLNCSKCGEEKKQE